VSTSFFIRFAALYVMVSIAAGCGDTGRTPMPTVPSSAPTPTSSAPDPHVGDVYRLTFDASPSCQLPEEARHRTYTATIGPWAERTFPERVTLTDAQFYVDGYCGEMNSFDARFQGDTLFLSDYGGDCGVVELLPNQRFLDLWGEGELTGRDHMTGVFNGSVRVAPGPPIYGSTTSTPTASCSATDHTLTLERTSSAKSTLRRSNDGPE
jgi:hypothetical protein